MEDDDVVFIVQVLRPLQWECLVGWTGPEDSIVGPPPTTCGGGGLEHLLIQRKHLLQPHLRGRPLGRHEGLHSRTEAEGALLVLKARPA